jgi:hypothetical protein
MCNRDVSPIGRQFAFCTIQEPGANAGENPAASLNDLVGSSSNFKDIPAIHSVSVMGMLRQLLARTLSFAPQGFFQTEQL